MAMKGLKQSVWVSCHAMMPMRSGKSSGASGCLHGRLQVIAGPFAIKFSRAPVVWPRAMPSFSEPDVTQSAAVQAYI